MSREIKPPAPNPCGSCPYRLDVASGIWDASEYEKLAAYDGDTASQPIGLFLCHQQNGAVCSGWCGTHDMYESLALRFAAGELDKDVLGAILDYETTTPLFDSGREAAEHGLAGVEAPDARARREIEKLTAKARRRD